MAGLDRIPDGPWDKLTKSHYWLPFKKIPYYSDFSGNEYIELQKNIREMLGEVINTLKEHGIEVVNVATQQHFHAQSFSEVMSVAIAFKSREDLVMAKMLVKCDD